MKKEDRIPFAIIVILMIVVGYLVYDKIRNKPPADYYYFGQIMGERLVMFAKHGDELSKLYLPTAIYFGQTDNTTSDSVYIIQGSDITIDTIQGEEGMNNHVKENSSDSSANSGSIHNRTGLSSHNRLFRDKL